MTCLQIHRTLLSLGTFFRVHSNSKEVSYLSWQNTYPNLKTTCHIKLKFFLWTKLLENLLLAKYLISVAATLIKNVLFLRKSYYFKECAVSKKHFPDIEPCSNILVKGWYMFSFIWKKYQYFSVVLFLIDIILCLPSVKPYVKVNNDLWYLVLYFIFIFLCTVILL